jgi:toxin ParE1/3/4
VTGAQWRIRLGAEAEADFVQILKYTRKTNQAESYKKLLSAALAELTLGPSIPGSAARDEILSGLRTLHIGRRGRQGRHFIMYRAGEAQVIEVIRILHDAMDLARHVPVDDLSSPEG